MLEIPMGMVWVLIPIFAIGMKTLREIVLFKRQQRHLGSSNEQLEKLVAELRTRERALEDRLENLEAIVVSQTWDVVHDKSLPPAARELKLSSVAPHEMAPPSAQNSQRAEVLARRLKG